MGTIPGKFGHLPPRQPSAADKLQARALENVRKSQITHATVTALVRSGYPADIGIAEKWARDAAVEDRLAAIFNAQPWNRSARLMLVRISRWAIAPSGKFDNQPVPSPRGVTLVTEYPDIPWVGEVDTGEDYWSDFNLVRY